MTHEPMHQPAVAPIPEWGVVIFESHHARDFRMSVSRHSWLEVFYVLEGSGVFVIEDRPVTCGAGDVVVVPVGQSHRIRDDPDDPLAMYGVRIRPDVWKNAAEIERLLPSGRVRRNRLITLQTRAEFRQLLIEQNFGRPASPAMMIAVAMRILAMLARSHSRLEAPQAAETLGHASLRETVEAYIAELDHRFLESTKMDNVVRELGMSRRRFTELFRELTGATWSHYVRRLRVRHAADLLRSTDKSVVSIAFESGFEDLSSFYRAFQREQRTSPQRWRHKNRGSD